jgi:hypothetical protein
MLEFDDVDGYKNIEELNEFVSRYLEERAQDRLRVLTIIFVPSMEHFFLIQNAQYFPLRECSV